jgi:hypothetical protein
VRVQLFVFTDAGRVCRPLFIVDPIDEENGIFEQSLRITGEHIEGIKDMEERLDAFNANPDDPDVYLEPEDKFVGVGVPLPGLYGVPPFPVFWSEL